MVEPGSASGALARRLEEAKGAFNNLCAVWRHANLTKQKKLQIFDACIASKLLYSVDCECVLLADRKRLDGFYCRCLRTIQNIPHSMVSHIANEEVLRQAGVQRLSEKLHARQLILFARVALLPDTSIVRRVVFEPSSVVPAQSALTRRRGRPKLMWASTVYALALAACNHDAHSLHELLCEEDASLAAWKSFVKQ